MEPGRPDAPDGAKGPRQGQRLGTSEASRQAQIARLIADGHARDAVRLMEEITCSDPANGRLHTQLGQLMKAAGMNGFMAEFRLGTTTPHDHPVSPVEREADRASRAVSCILYGLELAEGHDDVTAAFESYHEAHRLDSTNAQAYVERARLVLELDGGIDADETGERELALRQALKCIGDNAVVAAAHSQLANILLHKQRRKDAVRHAQKAIALDRLAAAAELCTDPTFASLSEDAGRLAALSDHNLARPTPGEAKEEEAAVAPAPPQASESSGGDGDGGGSSHSDDVTEPAVVMSGQQRRLAKLALEREAGAATADEERQATKVGE